MATLKSITDKIAAQFSDTDHSKLTEFFIEELKDIYWAEKNLVKALPKMVKAATTEELKAAFKDHTAQTEVHVQRLEGIFESLGEKAASKKCEAMEGLIKEANSLIEDTESGTMVRDTALIFASQKVEHYEIATYGSLLAVAKILKLKKGAVINVLEKTLNEEKATDEKLTLIAESFVNESAAKE
jgi:ferritin-like metal-binding protein YciE